MKENELPKGIGRPATSALIEEGYTKLEQLTGATEKEILALHGVGPKAIRILTEEMAAKDLKFKK